MTNFPNPSGRPCLNLISTLGSRLTTNPNERLQTPADLDEWLTSQDLSASRSTRADLVAARSLREASYALVNSAISGTQPDRDALDIVNDTARTAPRRQLTWTGTAYAAAEARRPALDNLALVAADTIALLTSPDRDRLHQCEAHHCATPFLISPGTRPRRWCSSKTCGNRARVHAYRQRARA